MNRSKSDSYLLDEANGNPLPVEDDHNIRLHGKDVPKIENPKKKAKWYSLLTISWLSSLFSERKKHALQLKDLYEVLPYHSSRYLHQKVKNPVNEYSMKFSRFKFLIRCIWLFKSNIIFQLTMLFIYETTRIIIPVLLGILLQYFEETSKTNQMNGKAFAITTVFGLVNIIFVTCSTFMWQEANVIGMRFRVSFTGLMYDKILKLAIEKQRDITSGKIITLLSSDLEKFNGYGIGYLPYCIVGPVSCIIVTIVIAQDIGYSAALSVPAAGILMLILPGVFSTFEGKLWKKTVPLTDCRVQFMNEIVTGMKLIKMYVWEQPFMKLIKQARGSEMMMKLKGYLLRSLSRSFNLVVVKCMILSAFSVAVITGTNNKFDVAILFKTIGLINVMLWAFVSNTTLSVFYLSQLIQCMSRLQVFLSDDNGTVIQESESKEEATENTIDIKELYAFWLKNEKANNVESTGHGETIPLTSSAAPVADKRHIALENINLEMRDGQLAGVTGRVGSGKSTLLHVLLKEASFTAKKFFLNGTVSYAPQEAWIYNDSVRENILFGAKYNHKKFWNIIGICALERDLEELQNGEWTLVGERGLMLSGGQKARINLARALYRDADIYLLDDPLSAVDTKVGRHIYNECIKKYLSNKTVVLVTHQKHFLEDVDTMIVLDNGRMQFHGKYDKQVENYIEKPERKETLKLEVNDVMLPQEEDSEGGSVSWRIYYQYITHGSRIQFILVYVCFGVALFLHIYTDWILGNYAQGIKNKTSEIKGEDLHVIKQVGLFIVLIFILDFIRNLLGNLFIVRASQNLHNKMFEKIMTAPMRFFDVNPAGRVLNRFSRDLAFVDDDMANQLPAFVMCVGGSLAAIVIPIFTVIWSIIAIVPLVILLVFFLLRANPVIRDMKRLEATARSPIYTHISDTISGLLSIRAFHEENTFMEKLHDYSDNHTKAWYLYINSQLWLGLRLNWLMATFINIVAFISVPMSRYVDISLIGVTLMHTCANLDNFEYTFRSANAIEVIMTSVERILHYTKLETEGKKTQMGKLDKEIESTWPRDGCLEFKNVTLKYTEDSPSSLSDLNFKVAHAEKIGIVGRTGAGKSSLLSALFRLAEPTGSILLDGVDVTTLPLPIARFNFAVIPQEPFIFAGTVRRNIDPLDMHNDEEIWDVLDKVELRSKIESMDGYLDSSIRECGSNLSAGERQLVCLARALLKKAKVIVLDEATANVDDETDRIIQIAIRKYFSKFTIITIAHRLNTIMDYDRIFVLDSGRIVEMGSPQDLLKTDGVFKQLASKMHNSQIKTIL